MRLPNRKFSSYNLLLNAAFVLLVFFSVGCEEAVPPPAIEEKVTFYEVDPAWADTTIAHLSLEEKINQLILIEADSFDSSYVSNQYAGVILNGDFEAIINASNCNRFSNVPSFLGSESIQYGGLMNDPDIGLQNIFGLSTETLDSVLAIEKSIRNYLGLNFSVHNVNDGDSIFQPLIDYSARAKSIHLGRLSSNFSDTIIHVAGNWHLAINDSTPINAVQEVPSNMTKQLVDSGMLALNLNESSLNGNDGTQYLRTGIKEELDFEGLIVTSPVELQDSNGIMNAFNLGADLIKVHYLDSARIRLFKSQLAQKVVDKEINEKEIDNRVRKTLLAKTWMKKRNDSLSNTSFLNKFYVPLLGMKHQIYKESIILVKNDKNRIPVNDLMGSTPCLIKYGRASYKVLFDRLNVYDEVKTKRASKGKLNPNDYKSFGHLFLAIHETLDSTSLTDVLAMAKIDKSQRLTVINLDHPENLELLRDLSTVIQVFGTTKINEEKVAEAVYGGIDLKASLPKAYARFEAGHGLTSRKTRLEYSIPEEGGIHADSLKAIRSIARQMIFSHTSPGCQVMAIKDGKVIYQKSFGYHTYDKFKTVTNNDVYDLASVTKITATTPSFMRFYEEGIFKLDDSLNKHIHDSIARVNKRRSTFHNVTFREMLVHKSGAPAGMKILPYIQYQDDSIGKWDSFFCNEENSCFSVPLSGGFYLDHDYVDSLWLSMHKTWLNPAKPYKYSDINMNMLYMLMKSKIPTQTFSRYVDSTFYKPLGLKTMGYHPLTSLDTIKHRITPTEYDTYWRGEVLKGYVHDPTAALLGGEAGSAGLFSNVHDLGIFYQMLLNGGTYGGKRYFQQSTVDLFTRHQPGSFRGLGFNKPTGQRSSTKSIDCPTSGYGHTGFTGICVWVDPVNDLIFVFCSNRVHPSPSNNKINTKGIRARMHQVLYNQILGRPETRDTTMLP